MIFEWETAIPIYLGIASILFILFEIYIGYALRTGKEKIEFKGFLLLNVLNVIITLIISTVGFCGVFGIINLVEVLIANKLIKPILVVLGGICGLAVLKYGVYNLIYAGTGLKKE